MKQHKILKNKKEIMEYTHSTIENTKKFRRPSVKVDKLGTSIGIGISISCIGAGIVQFVLENYLYAGLTLAFGMVALISNCIHYYKIDHRN